MIAAVAVVAAVPVGANHQAGGKGVEAAPNEHVHPAVIARQLKNGVLHDAKKAAPKELKLSPAGATHLEVSVPVGRKGLSARRVKEHGGHPAVKNLQNRLTHHGPHVLKPSVLHRSPLRKSVRRKADRRVHLVSLRPTISAAVSKTTSN